MNKKALIPLILLLAVGVFFSFRLIADKPDSALFSENSNLQIDPYVTDDNSTLTKNQVIQETIMRVIKEGHYSPKMINDEFSVKVFEKYLEMTDFGKLFLLSSDISEFKAFEKSIDDEIQNGTTKLYDLVNGRMKTRMSQAEAYYQEVLKDPFTYTEPDEIELDGKKLNWCDSEADLKARWKKSMKYRSLVRFTELKEQQKTSTDKKEKAKTEKELEQEARESVRKNMDSYFKRLKKINDSDRFATYINSLCHVIDPHTDFFPPKDKQRFDEEMSGKFYGIGAVLQNEEGVCKIKQIVTGSPCWKEGRLKVNDVIMKVAQGAEDPVEIAGWDIEDIVSIIRGKQGSEVRLTVKHMDGNIEIITIIRGEVQMEDTFAKSIILKNNGLNIGYIHLPEFYADFNDRNGRRCATDMEKEINKLKAEGVNAIIVDLRYNGGGSLTDVVDIGGMFIDKGPIVQVKSKDAPAQPMNDRMSGTLYDGPLAILINQGSASASEILAAAMQDYKRAIIIGSTSFGKGTVQRVFPLEEFYQGDPSVKPAGSIKLTLQKFYRVNGGSTQLKGVTPDIQLPDIYDYMDIGERKDSNSLAWDQVAKADFKPIKPSVDFNMLIEASRKRAANTEAFKIINQNATRLKKQSDDNRYYLKENQYLEQIAEAKDLSKKMENIEKSIKPLTFTNLAADKATIQRDTVAIRKNEDWIKNLKKDPYIIEASNVLQDWIKLSKGVSKVSNSMN